MKRQACIDSQNSTRIQCLPPLIDFRLIRNRLEHSRLHITTPLQVQTLQKPDAVEGDGRGADPIRKVSVLPPTHPFLGPSQAGSGPNGLRIPVRPQNAGALSCLPMPTTPMINRPFALAPPFLFICNPPPHTHTHKEET